MDYSGINTRDSDYTEIYPYLRIVRDAFDGVKGMKKNYKEHLRKWNLEEDEDYETRAKTIRFHNYFKKSINDLTNKLFKKDVTIKHNDDEKFKEFLNNVDGEGNDLNKFLHSVARNSMRDGVSFIWVDATDTGIPFLRMVEREQLINKIFDIKDGVETLELVVIEVDIEVRSSQNFFKKDIVKGHYVLTNDECYLEINGNKNVTWNNKLGYIPIFPIFSSENEGKFKCDIPLLDLAQENIAHMNKLSSLDNILMTAGGPVPVLHTGANLDDYETVTDSYDGTEVKKKTITVGTNKALTFDSKIEEDFKWVELEGKSISSIMQDIENSEEYMKNFSVNFSNTAKTAKEVSITSQLNSLFLVEIASSLSIALYHIIDAYNDYTGSKVDAEVILSKDFEEDLQDANMVIALSKMEVAGQITKDILWDKLKRASVLPDFDNEEVKKELDEEEQRLIREFGAQSSDDLLSIKNKKNDQFNKAGL